MIEISPEMRQEIAALKTTEELKAYCSEKGFEVPDSKLEAILKLSQEDNDLSDLCDWVAADGKVKRSNNGCCSNCSEYCTDGSSW